MEWICLECNRVVCAKEFQCCGKTEKFDPLKHGSFLVGKSNAWIEVWKQWEDHPILKRISFNYNKDGCHSAPIILNGFIEELLK